MRPVLVPLLLVSLSAVLTAGSSTPAAGDAALLEALRRDDPLAVAAATGTDTINAPDDTGATPLMHAVIYSRPAIVEQLLDRGANVNAANAFGSTALMWAAPRTAIVRMLVARGAAVNAKASDGTTAIVVAARVGNLETMNALIRGRRRPDRAGDALPAADGCVLLPASWRASRVSRIAEGHAAVRSASSGATCSRGEPTRLRRLLTAGANPSEPLPLVTITMPTYFAVARQGGVDALKLLEKAGVDPNVRGGRGWTALMLVAADDDPSLPALRHLIAGGADVNAKDDEGRTALDWALTRGETAAAKLLREAGGVTSPLPPAPVRSAATLTPRDAVARAIARLQPVGPGFSTRTRCNSCHNQNLPNVAVHAARDKGVSLDETLVTHAFDVTQQNWRGRREITLLGNTNVAGFELNVAYGLFDLAETGAKPTPVSEVMILGLAERQGADGSWPREFDIRPPLTTTTIMSTALALRGLELRAAGTARGDGGADRPRGRFLRRAVPTDTQDQTFKLLGLLWAGGTAGEIAKERAALIAWQRGWRLGPESVDGTGRLRDGTDPLRVARRGRRRGCPVYRKGVDYLLRTQLDDGTWFVRSRAFGFQPYFETGFPHGRSQFISTAATAWAATAIAYSLE